MIIEQVKSTIESLLFASDRPVSFQGLKSVFSGTDVDADMIQEALNHLQTSYEGAERGVHLEQVAGGYQLRTKQENADFIRRMVKGRPFRLSGPAMEVLSIVAYKQPVIKAEIDQIRGVESGHILRALMEKGIIKFEGKSELPGKPMLYGTTKEFLELFGLRNVRELPSLQEIDELIPEGMGEMNDVQEIEKETLETLSEKIGLPVGKTYSESEEELLSISDDLTAISTTTEFFEQEKRRQKEQKERDRAQDIRERMIMGELVEESDKKWLERFDKRIELLAKTAREVLANEDVTNVISVRDRGVPAEDIHVIDHEEFGLSDIPATDEEIERAEAEDEKTPSP